MSYLFDVSPHDGAVVDDVSESGVDVERRRQALPVRSFGSSLLQDDSSRRTAGCERT